MSWMLNHISARVFAVTTAQGFCSVCRLSQPQTDFLKCRGSRIVHSHPYVPGLFGSLVFPLLHDSEIRKVFLGCGFWATARLGSYREQPWMSCHNQRSLYVTMFTPWRADPGESFCSWSQVWNMPASFSLTMELLPSLNRSLSFSSSHVIINPNFTLQIIFPIHAGFHPLLQQEGSWRQVGQENVPQAQLFF